MECADLIDDFENGHSPTKENSNNAKANDGSLESDESSGNKRRSRPESESRDKSVCVVN